MNSDQQLTEYVARVDRAWARLGVAPVVRRRLGLELEADLATAHAAGAPAEELTAADPVAFAVDLAQAADAPLLAPRAAPTRGAVVGTAVLGAALGAVLAWVFVETGPVGHVLYDAGLSERYAWIPVQVLALLVTLGGVVGAVWWRFRRPGLAVRAAGLALAGGLVAAAPLVGYASVVDYSTAPSTLVTGAAMAALVVAAAVRLGTPRS